MLRENRNMTGETAEALGELAQAKIRFGMNAAFIVLGLIAYRHEPTIGLAWVWSTFLVCFISAFALYVWARLLGNTLVNHGWRVGQRIASIVIDNLAVTWLLYFGGQALAGAYGVYLWITIGYGMRFGLQYLYGNLVASMIGYLVITRISPFWSSNPSLSTGLGIALLVIPIYASFLIQRLHAAIADARLAYAAKSDFVARMSHELRTPLHGIISVADLLARTEATVRQKEMFRIISVSSNTLLDLINRILDVSKFEDGTSTLQRSPMNLHGVIHDAVSILWPQAQLKGLEFDFFIDARIEPAVIGSPLQLQEVLINLCGNAIKFTEAGRVSLRVMAAPATSDKMEIQFEIKDTGPGIAAEDLDKIFNPFYQADTSVTRRHAGTGLGTAIARELVRLMGGEISVESVVGQGTLFTIELAFERQRQPHMIRALPGCDVAWLGSSPPAEVEQALHARQVRLLTFAPGIGEKRVWLANPPAMIMVDLVGNETPASLVRDMLDGPGEELLIPLCGVGPDILRTQAVELGFNSFLALPDPGPLLDRILGLSTEFRRDYTGILARNESLERIRVLVAEDNLTNQTIARMALAEGGFECTVVSDGEQAVRELTQCKHDIALIDMHMPVMDGMEVVRLYHFAITDPAERIPIVMVTADSRPEIVADAELAGVTRFLTKPLKPSAMIETINRIMRARGREPAPPSLRSARDRAQQNQPARTPGILDREILDELLEYMEVGERESFFNEFFEDAQGYIEGLSTIEGEQSLEKIRGEMHALSGAARTIGATKLAAYARRVEFMSGVDIRNTGSILRDELAALLDESTAALRQAASLPAP